MIVWGQMIFTEFEPECRRKFLSILPPFLVLNYGSFLLIMKGVNIRYVHIAVYLFHIVLFFQAKSFNVVSMAFIYVVLPLTFAV